MWKVSYIDETAGDGRLLTEIVDNKGLDNMMQYDAGGIITLKDWEEINMMNYDSYRSELVEKLKKKAGCYTGAEVSEWENSSIVQLEALLRGEVSKVSMEDLMKKYPVGTLLGASRGLVKVTGYFDGMTEPNAKMENINGTTWFSATMTELDKMQRIPKVEIMQMGVDLKNGTYKKIAFTGHRPDKLGGYEGDNHIPAYLHGKLRNICDGLILHCGSIEFMSGMAQGIDQTAAKVILNIMREMRVESNGDTYVHLYAAVPYPGQEDPWPKKAQDRYNTILDEIGDQDYDGDDDDFAGYVHRVHSEKPVSTWRARAWLDERNHYMVDWCDLLIAVWDGTPGGTKNCIDYAKKAGKPILLLSLVW